MLNGQGADELLAGYAVCYNYVISNLIKNKHFKKWAQIMILLEV